MNMRNSMSKIYLIKTTIIIFRDEMKSTENLTNDLSVRDFLFVYENLQQSLDDLPKMDTLQTIHCLNVNNPVYPLLFNNVLKPMFLMLCSNLCF